MPPSPTEPIKSDSSPLSLQRATLDRILEVGGAASQPIIAPGGKFPFIVVPNGCRIEQLDQHVDRPRPQFINTRAIMLDAESFAAYVNRYKDDRTLIYANVTETTAQFVAVLDYHTPAAPEFCGHKCEYNTSQTPEFKIWLAANRKWMSQVEFATWLEDNQQLFVVPSDWPADKTPPLAGAELLELVQNLEGHQAVRFTSGVRLKSGGNSLHYDEDVQVNATNTTKAGTIALPDMMVAGFAPFIGSPKYQITARLKYSVEGRKLALKLETVQLHKVISDSINLLVEQVTNDTGIKPLIGSL